MPGLNDVLEEQDSVEREEYDKIEQTVFYAEKEQEQESK
jgi:hypothetical protein